MYLAKSSLLENSTYKITLLTMLKYLFQLSIIMYDDDLYLIKSINILFCSVLSSYIWLNFVFNIQ